MPKPRSPRERAARALCQLAGNPENITFEGKPLWQKYLTEVDTVLRAALTDEEWSRIVLQVPHGAISQD